MVGAQGLGCPLVFKEDGRLCANVQSEITSGRVQQAQDDIFICSFSQLSFHSLLSCLLQDHDSLSSLCKFSARKSTSGGRKKSFAFSAWMSKGGCPGRRGARESPE